MLSKTSVLTALGLSAVVLATPGCVSSGRQPSLAIPDAIQQPTIQHPFSISKSDNLGFHRGVPATRGAGSLIARSWMLPTVKNPGRLIYVSDIAFHCVNIYHFNGHNQKLIGQISIPGGGPGGVAVDRGGNLWVAVRGSGGVAAGIAEYPRGATIPSKTLNDSTNFPDGVVVNSGTVYVSNFHTPAGPGNVAIYANGSINPTQTLTYSRPFGAIGIALDKYQNIFIGASYYNASGTGARFFGEFRSSGSNSSYTFTPLCRSCYVEGLAVDGVGNVVTASQEPPPIQVYSPPKDDSKYWQVTHKFGERGFPGGATDVAFASKTILFVTYVGTHAVFEYAYPSGHKINEIIDGLGEPLYIAISP